jgi:hypothetical protein
MISQFTASSAGLCRPLVQGASSRYGNHTKLTHANRRSITAPVLSIQTPSRASLQTTVSGKSTLTPFPYWILTQQRL